jgi:hypothetical protein
MSGTKNCGLPIRKKVHEMNKYITIEYIHIINLDK